jgi:hypothetical protein
VGLDRSPQRLDLRGAARANRNKQDLILVQVDDIIEA